MPHRLLRDPGLPVSDPTTSYWQTPPRLGLLNVQSPNLPTPRDVVIIGSGVTGLSVSWWLLKEVETFSVTVIEAREICSGATGRNGGRINTPAVQDYAKYRCIYDDKTAASIVNFELAHYDAIRGVVEGLGAEALRESEIRTVEAIATAFTTERVAELWQQLRDFEEAFPHLKGQWRIADQDEVTKVRPLLQLATVLILLAEFRHHECKRRSGRGRRSSMAISTLYVHLCASTLEA